MTDPDDDPTDIAERIATSINEQLGTDDASRRDFLGRTALAGGGLLAIGSGVGLTLANDEETVSAHDMADFDDVEGTDLDVLNYALTLEHLEDAFYQTGLETFNETDIATSDALADFSESTRTAAFQYIQTAAEHESTHVDVLTEAVELLGGDPAQAAQYDFGVETVEDFLTLGATLENVGVSAYRGAAPFVESPDLLGVALSIHSVEARHAAIFNHLTGEAPFPAAFDPARSQQEVLDAAGPFINETDDNMTDGNMTDGNMTDGNMTEGTTTTAETTPTTTTGNTTTTINESDGQ